MLDKLTKLLQVVTAAAIAWVAVFNVGFFARIGYQFLGVMDVTSLLYTLGLAFIVILFFVLLIVGLLSDIVLEHYQKQEWWGRVQSASNRIFAPLALLSPAIPYLPSSWWPQSWDALSVGIGVCVVMALWAGITAACRYYLERSAYLDASCWCVAMLMLATFLYGAVFAQRQLVSEDFEITLKSKAIVIGKLVRTSSSGLLVFSANTMRFYPQAEIAQIAALHAP